MYRVSLARAVRRLFLMAFLVGQAHAALAQTTANPNFVVFDPSPDQAVIGADGAPVVNEYRLLLYVAGQAASFQTLSLGKPAPDADGKIRVDFMALLAPFATPGVLYEARVVAVGPGGTTASAASNAFQFILACSGTLTPPNFLAAAAGSTTSVSIAIDPGCSWTASSTIPWLTITSGSSGSGAGTFAFTVAPNDGQSSRAGTMTVARQPFTVTQASACTYALSSPGRTIDSSGGPGTVTVTSPSGCPWTATSSASWLTLTSSPSSSGESAVTFTAAVNTGASARTATLTIGGQTFTLIQEVVVCAYVLSPIPPPLPLGVSVSGANAYTWATSTADKRGMQRSADDRVMAAWFGEVYTIDVNVASGLSQQVALYMVDFDSTTRVQKLEVSDGATLLDTQTLTDFAGGKYLVWTVRGHVTIRVTRIAGPNALVSGILLGPATADGGAGAAATFVKVDDKTQGDWKGVYGGSGYSIVADVTTQPWVASGGAGSLRVTAPAGCSWTAASDAGWATVTSGASGSGPGTIGFSVAANASTSSRVARLTAGGQSFAMLQSAPTVPGCAVTLSSTAQALTAAGGTGSVTVAGAADCPWTASSSAAWLTVTSGGSGTGPGTVAFTGASNTGSTPRIATLSIGSQTVTVSQPAVNCSFAISATGQPLPAAGGTGSVTVSSPSGCAWTAVSGASWLTVTSGASGSGAGTVAFSASANTGTLIRTAVVTAAGQPFTVTQAGRSCDYVLSASTAALNDAGGAGSVTMTAPAGCGWTSTSGAAWLSVTAGASGSGAGTVTFAAAANSTTAPRSAALSIGGQTVMVTQGIAACTYALAPATLPLSGAVTVTAASGYTWAASTTDARALQRTTTDRIMAAWYGEAFAIDVTVPIGQAQQVALYMGDYDLLGRQQKIEVVDGTAVLDSRTVSNFSGGRYLVWTVQGHVTFQITNAGGPNAVISAVLLGPAPAGTIVTGVPAAAFVKTDDTTKGDWKTVYGASGYAIVFDGTSQWLSADGGAGSMTLTAPAGCAWTAASDASWITLPTASGSGSATVTFDVASATSASTRNARLTIGGQTFAMTQAGRFAPPCVSEIASTSQALLAAGGSGSVAVTGPAGCAWTAVSDVAWVAVTAGATGSGAGTVAFTAAANPSPGARPAILTIAGRTFTITQAGVSCNATLSATTVAMVTAGGPGSVTVTSPPGCAWTAVSSAAWLTVGAGATGNGAGAVAFAASANPGLALRTATLTVAGRTVTVTQGGIDCSYVLSAASQAIIATGGAGSVTVTAPAGCAWTGVSSAAWLSVTSGASGNGPGSVGFAATANTASVARTATLVIGGRTFTVTQAANPCTYAISATTKAVGVIGGVGMLTVTAPSGCAWTSVSSAAWLSVTSGASGTSGGAVGFTAAANTATAIRTATLTIAAKVFTVTQAAAACTYAMSPTSQAFTPPGGSGSMAVTVLPGCAWTAVSSVAWLTVSAGASGSGAGTVAFNVEANSATTNRTGKVTVGGKIFAVSQTGTTSCTIGVTPATKVVSAKKATGFLIVTAGAGCTWTPASSTSWLTITSVQQAKGLVYFAVTANADGIDRIGSIVLGGATFSITQRADTAPNTPGGLRIVGGGIQ